MRILQADNPINWSHPSSVGLVAEWAALPQPHGRTGVGSRWWLDLAGASHGNLTGGPTWTTTTEGDRESACKFVSASSQFVNVANTSVLQAGGGGSFTLVAWFVPLASANGGVCGKGTTGGTGLSYDLHFSSSRTLIFRACTGAAFAGLANASSLLSATLGVWTLGIGWYDAAAQNINVSLNNGSVASAAFTSPVWSETNPFFIGQDGAAAKMDGLVANVRLYKRVLSLAERAAVWKDGYGWQARYREMRRTAFAFGTAAPPATSGLLLRRRRALACS